ncbi:MAG: hypothetical protein M1837_004160, partial [Sclerophora amabilis]
RRAGPQQGCVMEEAERKKRRARKLATGDAVAESDGDGGSATAKADEATGATTVENRGGRRGDELCSGLHGLCRIGWELLNSRVRWEVARGRRLGGLDIKNGSDRPSRSVMAKIFEHLHDQLDVVSCFRDAGRQATNPKAAAQLTHRL